MHVDYKILSRDHKKSLCVDGALVDPSREQSVLPLSFLERLRSASDRLPTGYFTEKAVWWQRSGECPEVSGGGISITLHAPEGAEREKWKEAVVAGPLVLYISGQSIPVVLNPVFVADGESVFSIRSDGEESKDEIDLRLGLDAIEQCSLFAELRPGGLLYPQLPTHAGDPKQSTEPLQNILSRYGMNCGLAESPLNRRPWTKMKHMFIDELQHGPKLAEFVGYNPRSGTPWRFSQHNRYFRQGIWREIVRRNEMNAGLHSHSSWQKSHQQSVPEVPFLAPYP